MSRRFSPYPRLSAKKKLDFWCTWSFYVHKKKQAKRAIEEKDMESRNVEDVLINGTLYLRDDEGIIYDFITEDFVGKYDFNLDLWLKIYRPMPKEVGKIQLYKVEW